MLARSLDRMEGISGANAGTKIVGSWMQRSWIAYVNYKINKISIQKMTEIRTLRLSFAEPFLPSLPSSPSIPRRNAYAIRSAAGWRIAAGRR